MTRRCICRSISFTLSLLLLPPRSPRPLRMCLTHCGRGHLELAPVHRIGPDYAVRAYGLEHDSSTDSHDVLHPFAPIKHLHIFSVGALDRNWSVEHARFHGFLLAVISSEPCTYREPRAPTKAMPGKDRPAGSRPCLLGASLRSGRARLCLVPAAL